jgi:pimeloyl-ACP methyl ester carboxylesterase
VTHLILIGGYAKGRRCRADEPEIRRREVLLTLTRDGWDAENTAFRDIFTSLFVPHGDEQQKRWWTELLRVSSSPENAARLMETFGAIDVTNLLPMVAVPTLVLHSRNEAVVPFAAGREMAAGVPGARFVTLDSANHVVLTQEPAWQDLLSEIRSFLLDTHMCHR